MGTDFGIRRHFSLPTCSSREGVLSDRAVAWLVEARYLEPWATGETIARLIRRWSEIRYWHLWHTDRSCVKLENIETVDFVHSEGHDIFLLRVITNILRILNHATTSP